MIGNLSQAASPPLASTTNAEPKAQFAESSVRSNLDSINLSARNPHGVKLTNLLPGKGVDSNHIRLEGLTNRLKQARTQRAERDYEQAERTLIALLFEDAPQDIQRQALLEMGFTVEERKELPRAMQIYGQYVQRFKDDPSVLEVMLRQGLIYREMGAPVLALSKFYAVMSTALTLNIDRLAYYQRLVLQAQTEIADTYYFDGKFEESADFFGRLLKLDTSELNREIIGYKLVRSWAAAGRHTEAVAQAKLFVGQYQKSEYLPEIRFLIAKSLMELGRKDEGREQFLALLKENKGLEGKQKDALRSWQHRTGNELGNQFYRDGDFMQALDIYMRLSELNNTPTWRLPVLYQVGLIYENLKQTEKAREVYARLIEESSEPNEALTNQSLVTVVEMAKWRKERLGWYSSAAAANEEISRAASPSSASSPKL
jgi:tetratricopeptide (TPR) repeat protein